MKIHLSILAGRFTIHRLAPDSKIPEHLFENSFYSISRTADELSIVCSSATQLDSERAETDWSCIKVMGPLDFSLTGMLAAISSVLADAEISLFALSTFDTDYILVKSDKIKAAKSALQTAQYHFEN